MSEARNIDQILGLDEIAEHSDSIFVVLFRLEYSTGVPSPMVFRTLDHVKAHLRRVYEMRQGRFNVNLQPLVARKIASDVWHCGDYWIFERMIEGETT